MFCYNNDMKKLVLAFLLPVFAGCLTTSAPECSCWLIEYCDGLGTARDAAKYGVVRASQVVVRAPYSSTAMSVLRKDGTIAFDPYNEFAASPALLLKGVMIDALNASGVFKDVVGASSTAAATEAVELTVTKLTLDCREGREAVAELSVRVVRDREIVAVVKGEGVENASDGDYGKSFSRAVSKALSSALKQL